MQTVWTHIKTHRILVLCLTLSDSVLERIFREKSADKSMKNYTGCKKLKSCPFQLIPGRRQTKTLILSMNVDQKWLETEFLIAICRPTGNKFQSKTLFLAIFDPLSSIMKSVFDCHLPGVEPTQLCNNCLHG